MLGYVCCFKMFRTFSRLCTRKTLGNVLNYSRNNKPRTICSNPHVVQSVIRLPIECNLQLCRCKSKGDKYKQKKQESESETEEEADGTFLDEIQDKNTKILNASVTSMRLDAIVKAGLGLSRNKVEVLFYESKIRLNGEKVLKKSAHVNVGDEIDVVKGVNINNQNFLTVARIEVVSVIPKEESISVKLRRCKSLTIENYEGKNSW